MKKPLLPKESMAKEILSLFKQAYPDAKCALNFTNPLELLVATILSAQCTDKRVNLVTKDLFKKYKTAQDYARAELATFEQEIRSTGFYKNKAKSIIACCRKIVEKFKGKVPNRMEDLVTLDGVGRKTANVILGNAFNTPGIVVDTHVCRLSYRMGLTTHTDPDKIEQDLMTLFPEREWTWISHALIHHGRACCTAQKSLTASTVPLNLVVTCSERSRTSEAESIACSNHWLMGESVPRPEMSLFLILHP